jgi:hypothetical protein
LTVTDTRRIGEFMDESPKTAAEVMDLLQTPELLSELGMSKLHWRTMRYRGRIPGHWFSRIVAVARRHRLPISLELLASLAEAPARPHRSTMNRRCISAVAEEPKVRQ